MKLARPPVEIAFACNSCSFSLEKKAFEEFHL